MGRILRCYKRSPAEGPRAAPSGISSALGILLSQHDGARRAELRGSAEDHIDQNSLPLAILTGAKAEDRARPGQHSPMIAVWTVPANL